MKNKLIKVLPLMLAISANCFAQRSIQVVNLKDNTTIKGNVLKVIPGGQTILKTAEGDTTIIDDGQIASIETVKQVKYSPSEITKHWNWDLLAEFSRSKRDFQSAGISLTAYYKINNFINVGAGTDWRLIHFAEKNYEKVIVKFSKEEPYNYSEERSIETERMSDCDLSVPFYGAIKYEIIPNKKVTPYITFKYGGDFNMGSRYSDLEIGCRYKYKNNKALLFSMGSTKYGIDYYESTFTDVPNDIDGSYYGENHYKLNRNLFCLKFGIEL